MDPVVQKVDSGIHWTKLYPVDSAICFSNAYPLYIVIYPMDSAIQRLNNQGLERTSKLVNWLHDRHAQHAKLDEEKPGMNHQPGERSGS